MNTFEQIIILKLRSKLGRSFELNVSGISMHPILHDGDTVSICRKDNYNVGDILVFIYKDNSVLVHRLLKIENDQYFCKGDNSFRLENITVNQIIGAVQLSSDYNNNAEFISASLQISKLFRKCRYNTEAVKLTSEYIEYAKNYLGE